MKKKSKKNINSGNNKNFSYKITNSRKRPFFLIRWLKGIWNLFSDLHLKRRTKRELNAVILIFFSGITVMSLFNVAGIVGEWLKSIVTRTFGSGSFIMPIIFIAIAIRLFLIQDQKDSNDEDSSNTKKDYSIFRLYLGSFLFLAAILGLFHSSVPWESIKIVAEQGQNGGYFGFTVNFFLRPLFSDTGSVFVMIFIAIFSIQIAFELSWKNIFVLIYNFFTTKNTKEIVLRVRNPEKNSDVKNSIKQQNHKEHQTESKLDKSDFSIQSLEKMNSNYSLPKIDLLDFEPFSVETDIDEIIENKKIIKKTFQDFNIRIYIGSEATTGELIFRNKEQVLDGVSVGPTVTQYAFKPEPGVKLTKIAALNNDLALALAAHSLRIETPIPGKSLVGVEIPNDKRSTVKLRPFFESGEFKSIKSTLRLNIGRDVSGRPIVADLAKMPHLLVAGATGSGKSVCINAFVISLLYQNTPETLKLIMVDPKRVELSIYNGIPHLLAPVITDPQKTVEALRWCVAEMDRRYRLLSDEGYRNIEDYNKSVSKEKKLPYMVVLIDELADLMMVASKEVEGLICRLAQMARAIGIHLIVATQRPSVDVITGLIKANIPARIAFTVSSGVDSKTILDTVGAEKLLGMGDMLYLSSNENKPRRIQGIFLSSHEIRKVTNQVKASGEPDYDNMITERNVQSSQYSEKTTEVSAESTQLSFEEATNYKIPGVDDFNSSNDDELMIQAMKVIIQNKKASASFLQRRMRLGYARASRIIDLLEDKGWIGEQDGSKPRAILVSEESLNQLSKKQ